MLGTFILLYILPYIIWERPKEKPSASGRDLGLCIILPIGPKSGQVTRRYPLRCNIRTGERNISRSREAFLHRVRRRHVSATVQQRGANRVGDLTNMIVRTHEYPAAYGGFSDVWSCQLQCQRSPPERVAIKAIRTVVTSEEEYQVKKKAVEQELKIWVGLKHKNILPLYGITHGFGRFPAFVCPWADNGTLSEYLEKSESQLDMKKRMILLGDIAAGLQYLHSGNVAHGDLSGANVLVTGSGRACLSDFGLSTLVEQVSDTTLPGVSFPGNIRWAAPELFGGCRENESRSQLSSQRADIYSFGSVMLQTLTGKLPFHRVQRVAQIVIMISRCDRPPRERGWDGKAIPDVLWEFVQACWESPPERPSSEEIARFIKDQISRL